MTGPLGDDEFFDDEWVDIYDVEGRKASLRHLATVRINDRTYIVLGAQEENPEGKGALMLVREEMTADGATQYVVANDENEIEHVVGQFVMRLLLRHMEDMREDPDGFYAEEAFEESCGCIHTPGTFCYCGDPGFLQ